MQNMQDRSDNGGFTVIEVLIVVAIIGVIAAIAVPGLLQARMAGHEASAVDSLRSIISAPVDICRELWERFLRSFVSQLGDRSYCLRRRRVHRARSWH